jgi:hypothetical protein
LFTTLSVLLHVAYLRRSGVRGTARASAGAPAARMQTSSST